MGGEYFRCNISAIAFSFELIRVWIKRSETKVAYFEVILRDEYVFRFDVEVYYSSRVYFRESLSLINVF